MTSELLLHGLVHGGRDRVTYKGLVPLFCLKREKLDETMTEYRFFIKEGRHLYFKSLNRLDNNTKV